MPMLNERDLAMVAVMGQIAHPVGRESPYRIGLDGIPRILPGSGGIVLNHRVGDRCIGLAGDHIEPGVSLHNNSREIVGEKNGPNLALLTYACVGNIAVVVSGPCAGRRGAVVGKHGGVEHVIVDFDPATLRRLRIGDRVQIYSIGLGLKFTQYPQIKISSCSPRLLRRWGVRFDQGRLRVAVTHLVPAAIMGSGVGRNNSIRGDYDIQVFDPEVRQRFELESLRFGDLVAIIHSDSRYGRAYRRNTITVGAVVHSDSTVSGHGPGVLALLTAEGGLIEPMRDAKANLAHVLRLRALPAARRHRPLVQMKSLPAIKPRRYAGIYAA
jgi:hypothetical protein